MPMNWPVILTALAALQPVGQPPTDIEFTDPSFKGSLMAYERPRIPAAYQGRWADRPTSCAGSATDGIRLQIGTFAIDRQRVTKVQTYSDHPAIVVTLRNAAEEWLDIALDEKHISLRRGNGTIILMRCPDPPAPLKAQDTEDEGWLDEAKAGCKADDFYLFSDAFLSSPLVQRRYLAEKIMLVGPAGAQRISRKHYRRLPIVLRDYRVFMNDGSRKPERVKIDRHALSNGAYRLEWARAVFAEGSSAHDEEYQYGLPGWLIFSKHKGCWRLTEDGTGPRADE
jgi:hypothetical protein